MYSDPRKKRKCCDNIINKDTNKINEPYNDAQTNIDQKLQKMSKF